MTVLDKIKAFFKLPKPEAKAPEGKAIEPAGTKELKATVLMYSKRLLSLDGARIVGEAALAKAMENPDRPMSIAVADATGMLVYYVKMDNARLNFSNMAMNKVYTVIYWARDTGDIQAYLQEDGKVITDFGDPRFTTIPGGVCLRAPDGTMIGAIGTSGRVPNIDEVTDLDVALAGAKSIKMRPIDR